MYQIIVLTPDGDYTRDGAQCETIAEAQETAAEFGSKWYFYPFHVITGESRTDKARVMSACEGLEEFEGRTLKSVCEHMEANAEYFNDVLQY